MSINSAGALSGESDGRRKAYLDQLLQVLPRSHPWEEWLKKSGELPPDFDSLASRPDLPEILNPGGSENSINSAERWEARRSELQALFQYWVFGKAPAAPDNLEAEILSESAELGSLIQEVRLSFGPDRRASLRLQLLVPHGERPFPVFLTQSTHPGWALLALRRGYIGCVYAGADGLDDTDSFAAAYPERDWSRLARRAWAASRCIDYLAGLGQVDAAKIALAGHSRNGKQSLFAAAMDQRVGPVISSSSGAGGAMPARYFGESYYAEGIEQITRTFPDWFHPRLRFFSGREDRLPVDFHELVALVLDWLSRQEQTQEA